MTNTHELNMTTTSGHFLMHYNLNNIIFNFKLHMSFSVLDCSGMAKCRLHLTVILA